MVSDPSIVEEKKKDTCLNPCLSGTWSLTMGELTVSEIQNSLNPCLSGTWSLTAP